MRESSAKLRTTRGCPGREPCHSKCSASIFHSLPEVKEVNGRAIGETHDERKKTARAKESELVSDLPTVIVKCVGEVIKRGDSVRLRDKVTQSLMIKAGRTNGEDTLAVAAHGAQGVESRGGKGRRTTQRPLLRVRATRLRASASRELAKKPDILMERKREAVPPMPMALTVLERVQ